MQNQLNLFDSKIMKQNTIKAILGSDIKNHLPCSLTDEHLSMLDKERDLHITGQTKSYSRTEAILLIKKG